MNGLPTPARWANLSEQIGYSKASSSIARDAKPPCKLSFGRTSATWGSERTNSRRSS
jgi:hypothetical protein